MILSFKKVLKNFAGEDAAFYFSTLFRMILKLDAATSYEKEENQ